MSFVKSLAVTTFHKEGYDRYGRQMVETWLNHWQGNQRLRVYAENVEVEFQDPRLEVVNIHNVCPALVQFKERHRDNLKAHGKLKTNERWGKHFKFEGFFWDAVRFSHKSYAWCHAIKNRTDEDLLLWIDADCKTFAPVTLDFWNNLLPQDFLSYHLGRNTYSETGFVGFNLKHPEITNFAVAMQNHYDHDTIFNLDAFTDCHVLDDCIRDFKNRGHVSYDIVRALNVPGTHPFINSPLGSVLDHLKGPRKDKGTSHAKDLLVKRSESYWKNVN
jgi:hypothetical protein